MTLPRWTRWAKGLAGESPRAERLRPLLEGGGGTAEGGRRRSHLNWFVRRPPPCLCNRLVMTARQKHSRELPRVPGRTRRPESRRPRESTAPRPPRWEPCGQVEISSRLFNELMPLISGKGRRSAYLLPKNTPESKASAVKPRWPGQACSIIDS